VSDLRAESLTFKDGDIIFSEFEKGEKFYLIQSGNVEIVKIIGNVIKTLDFMSAGDMFGEMALLEDSPRSASAVASGETKVMVFDRNNFQSLMTGNTGVALKLLKMFAKRIYESKRRFMILTLEDSNLRVADVFLMLDETENGPPDLSETSRREIKTTVESIANWGGINASQAKEAIDHYVKLGYIEHYKDKILIKDINNFTRLVSAARSKQSKTDTANSKQRQMTRT